MDPDITPVPDESADTSPSKGNDESTLAPAIRLQRYLAQCGLGARRECEAIVTSGRVTIDGQRVTELGTKVDPKRQDIRLDGERLKPQQRQTFVFNKPSGVLCTAKDPQGRPRVIDFFPTAGPRLFTVGRLDENSTGLIIVTNDGDLAQKLAHPKYRIYRTYHIHVKGIPGRDALTAVKQGLWFEEGKFRVQSAKILKRQGKSSIMEVVLREGQNREVRRLFDRVGHKVMKLKRIAFGPVQLGRLALGKYRPMTKEELASLRGIIDRNVRSKDEDADASRQGKGGRRTRRPERRPESNQLSGGQQRSRGARSQQSSGEGTTRRTASTRQTSRKGSTQGRGRVENRGERRDRSSESNESKGSRDMRTRKSGRPRPTGKPRKPGRGR